MAGMEGAGRGHEPFERHHVVDLTRATPTTPPPEPGAQWDELHRRWERWDEDAQDWVIVGDPGDGVDPTEENPLPAYLARELVLAEDIEEDEPHIIDVDRVATPPSPVEGAQWNEVVGRWERWDDDAQAWVEARADSSSG
jgi:hypothetical protein